MSNNINGNIQDTFTQKISFKGSSSHPFHQLTPDFILNSLDELGYITDSRLLTLNSYENRVYQIGIQD